MIAITGDLVDGSVQSLASRIEPIDNLKAEFGVFFITGNHEYYSGAEEWSAFLRSKGIEVLLNESRILKRNGAELGVAGVTDYHADRVIESHKTNPEKAISKIKHLDTKIVLAHQPGSIYGTSKAGFDLQLSGHTHAGQFFPWTLFVGLVQPYVQGLHLHKNTYIYVNRGTGYWGPPVRLGTTSEITLLTLRRGEKGV